MGLDKSQLRPTRLIYGFANQPIRAKRVITLPITISQGEHTVIEMADFLVVDQPSTYNAIIGRPLMKKTNMVSVVYYLMIKFPNPTRVGYIKIDQVMARQCHIQSIHLSKQVVFEPGEVVTGDILAIECNNFRIDANGLDPRDDNPKPKPVEQTKETQIDGKDRTTRIGTLLNHD